MEKEDDSGFEFDPYCPKKQKHLNQLIQEGKFDDPFIAQFCEKLLFGTIDDIGQVMVPIINSVMAHLKNPSTTIDATRIIKNINPCESYFQLQSHLSGLELLYGVPRHIGTDCYL